jgi:lipopolysaccharide export system protein LptA
VKLGRVEIAVLAAGAIFLIVLGLSFRPGRRPVTGPPEGKLPDEPAARAAGGMATTLLDGFDFTESEGDRPLMRIQADRTVGYGPGAGLAPSWYGGEKVTLTLYPEDGPPVTVYSDRAEYDEHSRESRLTGNVRWTDAEGSLVETDRVDFHPRRSLLEAPRPVHFSRGSIDITAPSAAYDLHDRTLRFSGPVEATGNGRDSGGLSELTARQGLYRREQGLLELEFVDGRSQSGDRYAADRLAVKTGSPGGRTEWVRGSGHVHGILAASPGARETDPAASGGLRQYAGEESVLTFDGEGGARSLSLLGAPAILEDAERRLTARQIDVAFEGGRAVAARASGDVRVSAAGGWGQAERGELGFDGEGRAQNVTLDGNVRMESGSRRGEAARAVEVDARGVWLLTGDSDRSARVESAGSRLSADRIEIDRTRDQVRGEGKARAVFAPDRGRSDRTVPFLGDPRQPTYGRGERVILDDANQTTSLSGSASLWQEESSLFADEITLSGRERTLTAAGNVRAVMAPGGTRSGGPASRDRAASVATAGRLVYRDNDRTARFEGGVTMTRGSGWRAAGAASTIFLDKAGDVDCVEMSGSVQLADRAFGRSATAEKLIDYPKLGKTILWGSPARVSGAGGNQVAGGILTIADRGRSVEVTAPEGGKTETIHRTPKD